MLLVVIAGNIGSGKSTTVKALQDLLVNEDSACFVQEPVAEWRKEGHLEEFYKTGNAFEFQLQVLYSRLGAFETALQQYKVTHENREPKLVFLDRWFYEDSMFAAVNFERKSMTANQFRLYNLAYTYLQKHYPMPNVSVWLDVSPEHCMERLKHRGRVEEVQGITMEYLTQLNDACKNYSNIISVQSSTPLEVALSIMSIVLPITVQ
jgi:deoxyadenosine/deoxycytidine kinase